jgi:hypothetical protein
MLLDGPTLVVKRFHVAEHSLLIDGATAIRCRATGVFAACRSEVQLCAKLELAAAGGTGDLAKAGAA